jgi:hypothetical protein
MALCGARSVPPAPSSIAFSRRGDRSDCLIKVRLTGLVIGLRSRVRPSTSILLQQQLFRLRGGLCGPLENGGSDRGPGTLRRGRTLSDARVNASLGTTVRRPGRRSA